MKPEITKEIQYIGVNDTTLDLFESQYPIPNGVTYNSYIILDDKITIMDTVDARATESWLHNVSDILNEQQPSYLVISHLEPDHAANIEKLATMYPEMKLVGNAKTFAMLPQFFSLDTTERQIIVKEGDTLSLGQHTLQFFMAPMVHWPEVMVTYEQSEKILFSADGFGKFGSLDCEEPWEAEARRYYLNIVGKYGAPVQTLLKKAAGLDIQMICPLHGPVLKENLGYYIGKYDQWSRYESEEKGILIAYASIHGNTKKAAEKMADILKAQGEEKVILRDLSRVDVSYSVADAFCYDRIILACATYDGGMFPCMEVFLSHLCCKNFQNSKVGLIENGSWAPLAAKKMTECLEKMKKISIVEPVVTIRSTMTADNERDMTTLAKAMTD